LVVADHWSPKHASIMRANEKSLPKVVSFDTKSLRCSRFKARDIKRDKWCWSLEGSQELSVKSSRILIDNTILLKAEVPTRWLRVVPIKANEKASPKVVSFDTKSSRCRVSLRPEIQNERWRYEEAVLEKGKGKSKDRKKVPLPLKKEIVEKDVECFHYGKIGH
nr:RNA-directed DNA polymerase, eukaryota [Tanacetum cinerariifolium]